MDIYKRETSVISGPAPVSTVESGPTPDGVPNPDHVPPLQRSAGAFEHRRRAAPPFGPRQVFVRRHPPALLLLLLCFLPQRGAVAEEAGPDGNHHRCRRCCGGAPRGRAPVDLPFAAEAVRVGPAPPKGVAGGPEYLIFGKVWEIGTGNAAVRAAEEAVRCMPPRRSHRRCSFAAARIHIYKSRTKCGPP